MKHRGQSEALSVLLLPRKRFVRANPAISALGANMLTKNRPPVDGTLLNVVCPTLKTVAPVNVWAKGTLLSIKVPVRPSEKIRRSNGSNTTSAAISVPIEPTKTDSHTAASPRIGEPTSTTAVFTLETGKFSRILVSPPSVTILLKRVGED